MRKIKRLLCLLMIFSVFMGIAGCGNKKDENTNTENSVVIEDNTDIIEDKEEEKEETEENKEVSYTPLKPDNTEKPSKVESEKPSLSLNEIMNKIIAPIPSDEHTLSELPKELYKDVYGVDKDIYEDVLIYGAMINVKANEIILIKVKNESDVANAKKVLEERKSQVYQTWERYLPDQFEIVKKSQIVSKGKYVALIIAPYIDNVVNEFMKI